MEIIIAIKKQIVLVLALIVVSVWPMSVFSMDLDKHCTVNIMNRTVQVQPDGSWRMNNVPSFMGRVRARATCVRDGVTTSGQSAFFNLTTNNLNIVEDIFFDDPDPVPVSLSFETNGEIVFSDTSTRPLQVRAVYGDGSFSPLLNTSSGINFSSSNPDIVNVDNNGVLTPLSSGRVAITTRLEGAVAVRQVRVAFSGDMDGDGLPDSYEVANGLDPNDPIDAREDSDNDGLNALAEFNAGTDINSSDTDSDGITDGEEVVTGEDGYITNPILADTDGDGFSDGLEVDLGTDPSDDLSFDLANALDSITLNPGSLDLIFNGIDTEVSSQITVLANLIDGHQMNITSSSLGTSYSSANLAVASFGTTDGEIFGGVAGTTTITATNNGYSDSITVNVERFDPVALSAIDIPGYANNVDVQGDYAYVAAGVAGLVIVDVSDRTAPVIVSQLETDGTAIDVKVFGSIVYLADGEAGIKVIDVLDPVSPVLVSVLDTEGFAQDIDIDADYLYVADGDNGLVIANIIQPDTPFIQSGLSGIGRAKGVAVELNRIAIASTAGLVLIDASNINSLQEMARIANNQAKDVLVQGDYAYLSAYSVGYQVIDISDFSNPVVVAGDRQFVPRDAAIQDDLILFAEQAFANALPYVNISEPDNAVLQGIIDLTGLGDYAGTGIAVDNQYAYVTEEFFVVRNDYGISGNTKLFIAQYRQVTDNKGIPPSVNIVSPQANADVAQGDTIIIEVEAIDDLVVKHVEFTVNGERIFTDASAPYQVPYTIPSELAGVTMSVRAVDWGDNASIAERYIPILPDADGDGLSDEAEQNRYFTQVDNPDSDGDELTDYREVLLGTNPNKIDTDNDGFSDLEEINLQTNPLSPDSDGDSLSDYDEVNVYLTNPLLVDTDHDGISDATDTVNDWYYFINSDDPRDDLGREVNVLGDVNNDGINDFIVGAYSDKNESGIRTGSATVYSGTDVSIIYRFYGVAVGDQFGRTAANAGDINNDGVEDIMVGAPFSNMNGTNSGYVSIYSGRDGSLIYRLPGNSAGDQFGVSVKGIGDINHDNYDDVAIGAWFDDHNGIDSGTVYVFSGFDGSTLYSVNGENAGDYFAYSISRLLDINADGVDELIVGALVGDGHATDSGKVSVLSGVDGSEIYSLLGQDVGHKFGVSVSSIDDLNNDGIQEIMVGATGDDSKGVQTGSVTLFSGSDGALLTKLYGDSANEEFGWRVADAGDINNDGVHDFIVSAFDDDSVFSNAGRVIAYSGADNSVMYELNGYGSEDYLGVSLSSIGDIDNDGYADIIVGANRDSSARIISSNADWDQDGVGTLSDPYPYPYIYMDATTDYDNDGLLDLDEINTHNSDPFILDTDGDGLTDYAEVVTYNSNPLSADSDDDGLPDPWEVDHGFNLNLASDATEDLDNDGADNLTEYTVGTLFNDSDTDNDGLLDGPEIHTHLTSPFAFDSDSDGLSDFFAIASHSNPNDDTETFIDPQAVSSIQVTPDPVLGLIEVEKFVDRDILPVQLTVIASVEHEGDIKTINITHTPEWIALSYSIPDPLIATVNASGLVIFNNAGDAVTGSTELSVSVDNGISHQRLPVRVYERSLEWWLDGGSVELASDGLPALGLGTQTVVINDPVHVLGDLSIPEGTVIFQGGLWVEGDLNLGADAHVTLGGDLTANNVTLQDATLNALAARSSAKSVYAARLVVSGTIAVSDRSTIDVSGRGYPSSSWSGPDFSQDTRPGCHGDIANNNTGCSYGRYEHARFAGSGGHSILSGYSRGGGIVELIANELVLYGSIEANGAGGLLTSDTAGAGGSIHIEVESFRGSSGSLEASGGDVLSYASDSPAGAGGRISVYATTNSYTGSYQTSSGEHGIAAGAGTVYLQDASTPDGHLMIDNHGVASSGSTPIRSVGRHMISAVEQGEGDQWIITAANATWKPTDSVYGWGIDVDLDASEDGSAHYRIVSNTEDTITLETTDDLSGIEGQTLSGVHTFDQISVLRGAVATFGQDKVLINTGGTYTIDGNASIITGLGSDL
ncbi:hypothetical protein AB835_14200 [Candidatus Endobugula sertula]|uniref:BIG2 domain-containing protein n=1 Tax=Candidatus Endobugula sertula TaxID=62101 RepID=A0A1D2QLJ2_9GAMM|nr:hypothetical protein AB835_14200 [Candidatus Endobugula sertula]